MTRPTSWPAKSAAKYASIWTDNGSPLAHWTSVQGRMLQGYLGVARGFLTPADLEAIPDAIALLPFELGLRFLTDHLAGDVYFRTDRPGHNLNRALVQFRLAASVERQRAAIEALVERL